MRACWRRVRALTRLDSLERGLDEELRFHIDQQTAQNLRDGMTVDRARQAAHAKFGGMESIKDRARDEFRPRIIEDSVRDLRHGLRALRRTPSITIASCLTLALSIGAATTVFSVLNGVVIKPLPYPDSDALVTLSHTAPGLDLPAAARGEVQMSATQFFTYRETNQTFDQMGLWATGVASVTDVADPEQVQTLRVTYGTLQTLGVTPVVGRWFSREDDTPGSPETAILTYGYWQRRYGGDRSIIGRSVTVDSRPRYVVGVMPAGFRFLNADLDLLLPLRLDRSSLLLGQFNFRGVARLKPGVTLTAANADVGRMIPRWLNEWPAPAGINPQVFEKARFTPALRPLKDEVIGDVGDILWVLMGTIGIVLLIACANVSNLLLVRAEGRHEELAVRAALGAGSARIARQLMLESLVLGMAGGVMGLLLAFGALTILAVAAPSGLPRLGEITIDRAVLLFSSAVSLICGLLFGCLPVVKRARTSPTEALRGGGRTASESRERYRARNALVIAQVALAFVLLVGSGLMIRTLIALRSVPPGFTMPESLQMLRMTISETQVEDGEQVVRSFEDIRDRIARIPGVAAASFVSSAPMESFTSNDGVFIEDQAYAAGQIPAVRTFKFVSPDYFRVVGTPLVAGRDLTWEDLYERKPVALISENLAREIWPQPASALGRRIRDNPANPWREIVGIVGDVHDDGVHARPPTTVYWPALMENFSRSRVRAQRSATFVIRSSRAGSESFLEEIRQAVWAVNGKVPLAQVRTLGDVYARSMARTSFVLVMLATAGAVALLLGLVGIFGVISYAVNQRMREIGIRVALGARPVALQQMFIRQGLVLTGVGLAGGLLAAVLFTRFMSFLLFGVSAIDPPTYAAMFLVLTVAAVLASYVPARRATDVDPIKALRTE